MITFMKVVGLLILGFLILAGCTAQTPQLTPTEGSTPGPLLEIEAVDLQGNPVRLSDYRGSVVLVNFWASWCVPCKTELPVLQAYYQAHAADGFVLVGIDSNEPAETGAEFMRANGLDFIAWSDPQGALLVELGVNGLPYTIVVDREGHRVARWFGEADRERLDAVVTPLLDNK